MKKALEPATNEEEQATMEAMTFMSYRFGRLDDAEKKRRITNHFRGSFPMAMRIANRALDIELNGDLPEKERQQLREEMQVFM